MFSIPQNKTSKAISNQLITPLKSLVFLLVFAFSLHIANATEIAPSAYATDIDINEGPAGTVVRLTNPGAPFDNSTNTNDVRLAGGTAISGVTYDAGDNSLVVTIPCGASSGEFTVDGVPVPDSNFTYIAPDITTVLPDVDKCVGQTFLDIDLEGTLQQSSGLSFNWTNNNTDIGLVASGTGFKIPTFTTKNPTNEPITSTITVTPVINGCQGEPKTFTITVNPRPIVNTIDDLTYCHGSTVSEIILSASSPTNGTGVSYSWSRTTESIGSLATSGIISPIPSFTATNTGTSPQTTTFTVTPSYKGCSGIPETFTITVNPESKGGTITPTQTTICETDFTTLTLNGSTGEILRWESSTNNFATVTSIPNTANKNILEASPTINTKYRAVVQYGTCSPEYSDESEIIINKPTVTNTSLDFNLCDGDTFSTINFTGTSTLDATYPLTFNWVNDNTAIGLAASDNETTSILNFSAKNNTTSAITSTITVIPVVDGCEGESKEFTITVNPASTGGTITPSETTICEGGSATLNLTGSIGDILKWESKEGLTGSWNPISNTSFSLNATPTVNTIYRAVVQNETCSSIAYSNESEIIINKPTVTSILPDVNLCAGQEFTEIILAGTSTLDGTYPLSFNWENDNTAIGLSTNGNNKNSITNFIATNNTTSSITSTITVTPEVDGCEGEPKTFTITVHPAPILNTISNSTYCHGDVVPQTVLTTSTPNTGVGVSYTWTRSGDNIGISASSGTGSPISIPFNANNTGTTTRTTTFIVTPSYEGCPGTSETFTITVYPESKGGTITPTQTTICETDFTTLTLNGSIGTILGWESSTDNFATKNLISVVNNTLPVSPTVNTKYRAVVQSENCSIVNSDESEITVDATVIPGTVSGGSTICVNDTSNILTLTGQNGTVTTWQSSTGAVPSWSDIPGSAGLTSYTSGALTQTTSFRAMVANGSCAAQPSGATDVTIEDQLNVGNLNITLGAATVCENTPLELTLTNQVGSIIRWESRESSSSTWNPIPNTTNTYTANSLTASTKFRVFIQNGNCQSGYSPEQNIIVEKTPSYSALSISPSASSPICSGATTDLELTITEGILVRWETRSTVGSGVWNNYTGMINSGPNTYTTAAINTYTEFRAILRSDNTGICGGDQETNPITIDVNNSANGGTLNSSQTTPICVNTSTDITLTGQTGTVSSWEYALSTAPNSWTTVTPSNTTTTHTTGNLSEDTRYRAVINNGVCEAYSSEIEITVNALPNITDIPDQEACFGDFLTFGNPARNPNYSYLWSTGATTPSIDLTITTSGIYSLVTTDNVTGCSVEDSFEITMQPLPDASVTSDISICEGEQIAIGAAAITGSTYSWVASPSYAWTISDPATSANPNVDPLVTTTFTLTETIAATGCQQTNSVTISVKPDPSVSLNRGNAISMCEADIDTNLEATITGGYTATLWEVIPAASGEINVLSPTEIEFTPIAQGITNGTAIVRLTVTNTCGVTLPFVETNITIERQSIADAGTDGIVCDTNPITLDGSGSQFVNTYEWSKPTGITGSFTGTNTVNPVYTPSTDDVLNASTLFPSGIPFTLITSSGTNCLSDSSSVNVNITPNPIISAGPSTTPICENDTYSPTATTDANTTAIVWSTSGDGSFSGTEASPTPTYTPGVNDKATGTATLILTATGNSPCTPVTSETVLTIEKNPTIQPIIDSQVCASAAGPLNLTAIIGNPGSIQWTTNGGGSFNGTDSSATPIYTPISSDLNTDITFTVTVSPISPCGTTVTETFIYSINAEPIIDAGGDTTICESQPTITLNGTESNATDTRWTSDGSGSFDSDTNIDATYTFSPTDITNGAVTFTLTGNQTSCAPVSDNVTITIQKNPIVTAGAAQTICQGESVTLNGTGINTSGVTWVRSSGTGVFINDTTLNPTYTSSPNEQGTITFTIVGDPESPCATRTPGVSTTVTIIPEPMAEAGNDGTICEGENFTITTASATNINGTVNWSSTGGGAFTGENTLRPTYTPSATDITNGFATLKLTATKDSPCFSDAEDEMTITINKIPSITVINPSIDVCSGTAPITIEGVTASNFDTLAWTSSSSGSVGFSNPNPLNTNTGISYTPSQGDVDSGSVILTLEASRNPLNCNSSTTNSITLNFIKEPTVSAGSDIKICEGTSYTTLSAIANNNSQAIWSSTGTGTWDPAIPNTVEAKYIPSPEDILSGSVDLTLTITGFTPCFDVVKDDFTLSFEALPVITTLDASICTTETSFPITGTTVTNNYEAVTLANWTSTGTGTFSSSGDPLNPIYTPSQSDLAGTSVTLTLEVTPMDSCLPLQSETLTLSIIPAPIADAGIDLSECETPFTITTATAEPGTYSRLEWNSASGGAFQGGVNNSINPTYIPSATDIGAGTVDLILTAFPLTPCASPSVSTITVGIEKAPVISVTNQNPICEDAQNVEILGTSILNAASYSYTSTTGTIIDNETTENPLVTPSALDISNGFITLTITADANGACVIQVTETITIAIERNPVVTAGAPSTFCEGAVITTNGATADFVGTGNLQWSNNGGDGNFITSSNTEITNYEPGPTEISNGQVQLTLTGTATTPCLVNSIATVTHTIVKSPTLVIAPTVVSICEDEQYQVTPGQVTITDFDNVNRIEWTATSPGTIATGSTTDLEPLFTPSATDITNGFSDLTLEVTPIGPCTDVLIKTIRVNITKNPTIDLSANSATFCEEENKQLTATFTDENTATINWVILSGTGSISNTNIATPEYIPAADSETVVIEVSVTGNSPCATPVSQQITLNKIRKPEVTLPENTKIVCSSENTINLNALVTNVTTNTTYQWTSSNGGVNFSNSTNENTSYTYSQADKNNGEVTLTLTATSDVDCALTDSDEIIITIVPAPTVTITNLATEICEGSQYSASANATDATTYLWEKVGASDGIFTGEDSLNNEYIPGPNDILNGEFTIQITATGDALCSPVTTSTTVNIIPKPIIIFTTDSGETCTETPFSFTGVNVTNYSTLTWSSLSSNPGTFSNLSTENPTYTPSQTEKTSNNPIILRVTVAPNTPCDVGSQTIFKDFTLNLLPVPTAFAGNDMAICEGEVVALNGATTNDVSAYWTSSSTGTTVFANSKVATYTPSALDINNGSVTLTLHAVSNTNCDEITDSVIITIRKQPTAAAGPTVTICEDTSYTLLIGEAAVTYETSYEWTLSGGGTITPGTQNTLTPEFIPNPGQTGDVTLTLTALADPACGSLSDAIATKTIRITPKPTVSIPASGDICEGEDLVIAASDILTSGSNTLNWTSSNNLGTFIPNATGETTYRPATNQIGEVTITATATATDGACADVSADLVLTINPSVIVEAGSGTSICENETYTINDAEIINGNNVWNWSISGPATITAGTETTLTPEIVPNLGASGTVTLTLVANGSTTCPTSKQDTVTISINPLPIVDAGTPVTSCQGVSEIPLVGTVSNATSYSWSQTGGAGTIVPTSDPLAPKYIPAAADFISASGETIVTVFLEAYGNNTCSNIKDSMTITLQANPIVDAGAPLIACKGDVIDLSNATASNFDTLTWATDGDGTFDYTTAGGVTNPTYTLGSNDDSSVNLTMTATPKGVCNTNSSATITITVNQEPTILVSQDVFAFCGTTFTLPDVVTVSNSASYEWTNTTVVGNKSTPINPTSETPTISPTSDEITNGYVLLTLTAQPNTPCTAIASQTIRINLTPEVIVEAGSPKTVCATENLITLDFLNASVPSSNFYWTTNGTGTLTPANGTNTLQPQYQRGANETGAIEFTLHANNIAPCTGEEIDTVILNIDPLATADAGSDITICEGSDVNLSDANTTNASSIEWIASESISGTPQSNGSFLTVTTIENPSYRPSLDDIQRGFVYLIIKTGNTNSCSTEVASDYMRLDIAPGAGVFAGSNAKICMDDTYELTDAFANNAASGVTWSAAQNSDGTSMGTYISGGFSDPTITNPTYTPSADDINQGHVYLFIEGNGASSCPVTNSSMRLDITSKPSITTQENIAVCVDSPDITLSSTAENYETITWSVFTGPGTLSDINSLNPTFTHGISETTTTQETTVIRALLTPKDGCDSSETIIKEVTITTSPIPTGFAGDDGAVCYIPSQPIPLFTIENTAVSNATNLEWSSDGPGIFSSGTTTTFQSFSNNCPEIVNLTLTATGDCGTPKVIGVVELKINCEAPSLGTITSSIPAPQNVCQGTTAVSYQVPVNVLAAGYNWTVPTGAVITSSLPHGNAITVVYDENSTSGVVAVAASNDCGTSPSSTFDVTVTPVPRATTISGPAVICESDVNATYTAAPIISATGYQWTWTDGTTTRDLGITPTITLDITTATLLNSGDLQVRGINSCGQGIASTPFSITLASSTLSSTTTPAAICSGTGFNYNPTSASSGVTFAWERTIQSGISGNASGTGNIVNDLLENTTTTSQPVTYKISMTDSNGCIDTESITVDVLPVAQFVNVPDSEVCSGGTFSFDTSTNPTGTVNWSRAAVAGISETSGTGTGNIAEVLTNTTNAIVTVIYEIELPNTVNGCANTVAISVDVLPKPSDATSITGPVSVCNQSMNNIYTVAPIANATSYEWELDGSTFITTAINEVSIDFSSSATQTLRVRGKNCTEGEFSVPLTITKIDTPALSNISLNFDICSNEEFSFTPTSTNAISFDWDRASIAGIASPSNTGTDAINEVLVNTTNTPITVSYTYTLETVEGCTNTETVAVTVNPTPYITNTPVASICSGSNFTFDPTTNIPSNISWRRIPIADITGGSATGNGPINDPLVNLTNVIIPVSYEITLTENTTSCASLETIVVNVNPLPTATIESSTTTCFNSADSFINFIGENGVTPYTFTYTVDGGPQTTISTNGTATSVKLPLFSDAIGNYTYRLISVEDSSDITCEHTFDPTDNSKEINVEIFAKPTLTIAQPDAICKFDTLDITDPIHITDFDNTNLIYTYWRDLNATLVFSTPESATIGTYYIKAENNANGCSVTKPIVIQENSLPSTQMVNVPDSEVCSGGTFSFDTSTNPTGTVNWSRAAVAGISETSGTGTGNIAEVLTNTTNAIVTVIYEIELPNTVNGCANTVAISVDVLPKPSDATSITGPVSVCNQSMNNIYTVAPIANATSYEWYLDNVIYDTTAINEVSIDFSSSATQTLRVRGKNCTEGIFSNPLTITKIDTPALSNISLNFDICSNEEFSFTPTSTNAISFDWDRASIAGIASPSNTGTDAINEVLVNTTNTPITVSYTYTLATVEGCTNTETVAVTVNPTPYITNTPVASICSGSNFTFDPTTNIPSNISWRRIPIADITGGSATGNGPINDPLVNLTNVIIPVSYEITLTENTTSCASLETIVVNVNPLPTATIESSTTTCFNSADSFINFIGENGVTPYTFTYTVDGGPQTTISTNGTATSVKLPLFSDAIGNYTYRLISVEDSSDITCEHTFDPTDNSKEINVEIFAKPTLTIAQPDAICKFDTLDITDPIHITDFDNTNLIYTYWRDLNATLVFSTPESATIGTYYIKAENNANGCSVTKPIVIQENSLPSTQMVNVPDSEVCSGGTFNFDTSTNPTGTVNWSRAAVAGISETSGTGTGNIAEVLTNTTNAIVTVIYEIELPNTVNGCANTVAISVDVLPKPSDATSITGPVSVCNQSMNNIYTVAPIANATSYEWELDGSTFITTAINEVSIDFSSSATQTLRVRGKNCTDGIFSNLLTVTVFDSEITPTTPTTISQTVCEDVAISQIIFNVAANALSGYVEGLPNGVTATFDKTTDTVTIDGTPTETGIFDYTVFSSVSATCSSTYTGRITVQSDSNIEAPSNKDQTICSCGEITPIEFKLNDDTLGATVSGLPDGIEWKIINNVVTITGNSCDTSGVYPYTVSPQGSCTDTDIPGSITIKNISPIQVTNGNQNEELCINTSLLTDIVYQAAPGETLNLIGILPTGITFVADPANGLATLSGTPEDSGIYNYTVTSDAACSDSINGSILVNQDPFFDLMEGSINQVTCVNNPIETIRFQIAKNITDVNFTPALPSGISYAINNEQLIISGTPSSTQGNTTYTFNPNGSCDDTFSRQINLEFTEETTINLEAGSGLATQSVCQNTLIEPIQFTLLPAGTQVDQSTIPDFISVDEIDPTNGLWEITGAPLSTGVFKFNIESINSLNCNVSLPIQIENLYAAVSVVLDSGSDNQTLCNFNSPIENIVYRITGNIPDINIISVEGLPNGVTFYRTNILDGLLLTISGQANEIGEFEYNIIYDDCGSIENGLIKTSSPISINSTVIQTSCNSGASIDLNVYGGLPFVDGSGNAFYNINWEGPNGFRQNQLSISDLEAGDYTVTVSDVLNCGASQSKTFTIEPLIQLGVNLLSSSLANGCNGELGCANFEYIGGSGIYTEFVLEFLNPQTQIWDVKTPINNNYYNICGLDVGLYRVSVSDSKGCTTDPYMFSIENDNKFLIDTVVVQNSLCEGNDGSIIVEVISEDENLTFSYNGSTVSASALGDNRYELQIIGSEITDSVLEITNTSGCSISRNITIETLNSDFEYTSNSFENSGYFDVNENIRFTNTNTAASGVKLVNENIYSKIKWDFGDSTPFKTFTYPDDLTINSSGENIETVFHTYKNDGIYNVTLTSFNDAGCSVSVNKTIVVGKGSSVAFPTAFSPNNDGVNDLYSPTYRGLTEFTMFIYDYLGNLIFEYTTTDAIALENDDTWGWDGIEALNTEPKSGNYRCYFSGKTIDNKVIQESVRFLIVK